MLEDGRHNAHASRAPSAASRWSNCPGSIKAAEGLPDAWPPSAAASAGTYGHSLVETAVRFAMPIPMAAQFVPPPPAHALHLTDEMIAAAEVCLEEVRKLIRPDHAVELERTLQIAPHCWGHADVVLRRPGEIVVVDYKFGTAPVMSNAPQLQLYALGADDGETPIITTVIIQPRAERKDKAPQHSFSRIELDEMRPEWTAKIQATFAPDAPRKGGSWCFFCPVKINCPARVEAAAESAADAFADLAPSF